jgi:hypothetical protein
LSVCSLSVWLFSVLIISYVSLYAWILSSTCLSVCLSVCIQSFVFLSVWCCHTFVCTYFLNQNFVFLAVISELKFICISNQVIVACLAGGSFYPFFSMSVLSNWIVCILCFLLVLLSSVRLSLLFCVELWDCLFVCCLFVCCSFVLNCLFACLFSKEFWCLYCNGRTPFYWSQVEKFTF